MLWNAVFLLLFYFGVEILVDMQRAEGGDWKPLSLVWLLKPFEVHMNLQKRSLVNYQWLSGIFENNRAWRNPLGGLFLWTEQVGYSRKGLLF